MRLKCQSRVCELSAASGEDKLFSYYFLLWAQRQKCRHFTIIRVCLYRDVRLSIYSDQLPEKFDQKWIKAPFMTARHTKFTQIPSRDRQKPPKVTSLLTSFILLPTHHSPTLCLDTISLTFVLATPKNCLCHEIFYTLSEIWKETMLFKAIKSFFVSHEKV